MFTLDNFKQNKVLVVGDIMIDRYYIGTVTRISQEAPVPIFKKTDEYLVLGGAANTAANLQSANQFVSIASVIGLDDEGIQLLNIINDKKIDTSLILQDSSRRTTVKTRVLDQKQHLFRIDEEGTDFLDEEIESKFLHVLLTKISNYSIVVISDYMKGVLTYKVTRDIINIAKIHGIKVLIDVKDENIEKYKGAFLIKPNLKELRTLTGLTINSEEDVIMASNYLRELCNSDYVLTTQGSEGMTLVGKDNSIDHVKSASKEVFDVTGAGDTVIAYFAVGLLNNLSVDDSMLLSNYAAGIKVLKAGTTPVSLAEVIQYMTKTQNKNYNYSKILELSDLVKQLNKQRNRKIVFTNGCFDLLHMGHINYLKEASKLGDILIIGVNSDSSIRKLKGINRPIINETDRMAMLATIDFIDYIVMFDEETPINLIKTIQPDILVKGGDYLPHEVVGKDIVEAKGGQLVLIPFSEGRSTTKIIEKIVEINDKRKF